MDEATRDVLQLLRDLLSLFLETGAIQDPTWSNGASDLLGRADELLG